MKKNGYAKLISDLGAARIKALPVRVAKSISLGDLELRRQMGMDLAVRLAGLRGVTVTAEYNALINMLESRPDIQEELQGLSGNLQLGKFTILM
jgi:hypothetical protein